MAGVRLGAQCASASACTLASTRASLTPSTACAPSTPPPTRYNKDQSAELFATLNKYKTLAVLVGHTHGASVYSFNGTHGGSWGESGAGYIDVINAPATQKEDGKHNTLPSEFMVLEAAVGAGGQGSFRVAQRVGSGWGTVQGIKSFSC